MASKGIGQKFPTGAIFLIIAQVMTFYSRLINFLTIDGMEFDFRLFLEIGAYIAFAITILRRKRSIGMLITTLLITLLFFSNFTILTENGIFYLLFSLTNLITMLSLCVFALANLGIGFFEKIGKVFVVLFKISFFVGLFALINIDMRLFGQLESFSIMISLMVSVFHKFALYMVGLWMADGSRAKPVRKNAYLTDVEPRKLKRV